MGSVTRDALLSGANTIAIGDGTEDNWEVLQFQNAEPLGNGTFRLTEFLRGQAGSDFLMNDTWPVGSFVAVMDGVPQQMNLPLSARNTDRHMRFGPAKQDLSSSSYRYTVRSFQGNGYRPYRVCHARWQADTATLSWIRRTRIEGDLWGQTDVPLGEEAESYIVEVRAGENVLRTSQIEAPSWHYSAEMQLADGGSGSVEFAIAQVSARYGIGPFLSVTGDIS